MDMSETTEITITLANVAEWPAFQRLLEQGKVRADSTGRLRYLHGAPVGKLILVRVDKDGTRKYKESAAEWFDPDSPRARSFVWP